MLGRPFRTRRFDRTLWPTGRHHCQAIFPILGSECHSYYRGEVFNAEQCGRMAMFKFGDGNGKLVAEVARVSSMVIRADEKIFTATHPMKTQTMTV